jgi:hypothetical protein
MNNCVPYPFYRNVKLLFLSWATFILVLFTSGTSTAQILVTGTSFDPTPGNENRTYIGLNDIIHYGVQVGNLVSTPVIAPNVDEDVFNVPYHYAITGNPYNLDNKRYTDLATPDYMYIYSPKPSGGNTNVLQYTVQGMEPNTDVSVLVEYCSVVDPATPGCNGARNEFKAGINLDQGNLTNGTDVTQISMEECRSYTYSGKVTDKGEMIFRLNATRDGNCMAMGISKLEVMGFIKPVIVSNMGTELCVGEQISLQPTQHYNNVTYQWEVDNGSGWQLIPAANGGTNMSLLYELTTVGPYEFRLQVTPTTIGSSPVVTDAITVNAITCCEVGSPPVPASRQTVYYDNFGRLDMSDKTGSTYYVWDYSDVLNPVEIERTTTTPFRWPISPAPLGAIFNGGIINPNPGQVAPLQDGEYTVAAFLTGYNFPIDGYNGAHLGWANRVKGLNNIPNPDLSYDHSGSRDGAALFLNCPPNTGGQVLYSRQIDNLCFGKQLFFECWISVFTNSAGGEYNPVRVAVRLTEQANPTNTVTTIATATREADGGGVWVRVAAQLNLISGNSLLMEIINDQNVSANGNDLVLDDIKIMACAPPSVNLYFDLTTLSEATTVCPTDNLPLVTQTTTMLKNFYGNDPRFLYQWTRTPADNTSWQNLGTPVTAEQHILSNVITTVPFDGILDGEKVYFRVIVATDATFAAHTNFQAPNYANANDPCKSYSVSQVIEATLNCPLPVNLLHFTGWKNDQSNLLRWTTSSETNNAYFVVERSADGKKFAAIGSEAGQGTTRAFTHYSFDDTTPLFGNNYYRLQQVDLDGQSTYSKTIVLNNADFELAFDIYPNPNNGTFDIRVNNESTELAYTLDVLDMQGKLVYSTTGDKSYDTIRIENLASGIYIVRLSSLNQVITKKLLVY